MTLEEGYRKKYKKEFRCEYILWFVDDDGFDISKYVKGKQKSFINKIDFQDSE